MLIFMIPVKCQIVPLGVPVIVQIVKKKKILFRHCSAQKKKIILSRGKKNRN